MAARLKTTLSKTTLVNLIHRHYNFMNCDVLPKMQDITFKKSRGSYWLKWHCVNRYGQGALCMAFLHTVCGRVVLAVERIGNSADWCDSACEPCTCMLKKLREKDVEHITIPYEELEEFGMLTILEESA